MNYRERRVAALYDLPPLEYGLALAAEGYGDLTPHLLPRDEAPPRVPPREQAIRDFEALRREEIALLEEVAPQAFAGVREAWEAWWAETRPR
jgi:hypothetical protein